LDGGPHDRPAGIGGLSARMTRSRGSRALQRRPCFTAARYPASATSSALRGAGCFRSTPPPSWPACASHRATSLRHRGPTARDSTAFAATTSGGSALSGWPAPHHRGYSASARDVEYDIRVADRELRAKLSPRIRVFQAVAG
jgi:hypothetical protein